MTETGDALQVAVKGSEISLSILEKVITSGLRELEHMSHNIIAPGPPEKASGEPMAAVTIDNADVKEFASELKAQGVDFQILKNQRENENIFVFKAKDYATMQRAFENYLYKIHPEIERTPERDAPEIEQEHAPAPAIPEVEAIKNAGLELPEQTAAMETLLSQQEKALAQLNHDFTYTEDPTRTKLLGLQMDTTKSKVNGIRQELEQMQNELQNTKIYRDTRNNLVYTEKDRTVTIAYQGVPGYVLGTYERKRLQTLPSSAKKHGFSQDGQSPYYNLLRDLSIEEGRAGVSEKDSLIRYANAGEIYLKEGHTPQEAFVRMRSLDELREHWNDRPIELMSQYETRLEAIETRRASLQLDKTLLQKEMAETAETLKDLDTFLLTNEIDNPTDQNRTIELRNDLEAQAANQREVLEWIDKEDAAQEAEQKQTTEKYQGFELALEEEKKLPLKDRGVDFFSQHDLDALPSIHAPAPTTPEVETIKNSGMELPEQIAALEKEIATQEAFQKATVNTIRQDHTKPLDERDKVIGQRKAMEQKIETMRGELEQLKKEAAAPELPQEQSKPGFHEHDLAAAAREKKSLVEKNASILDKLQPKSNAPENLKEQQAAFKKFLAEKKATVKEYNAALKLSKGPQQPDRGLGH